MTVPVAAPPPDVLALRRDRLVEAAARASFGAILATRPEHVRYLTGVAGPGPRALLIGPAGATLVAPSEADPRAAPLEAEIDLATYEGYSVHRMVDRTGAFGNVLAALLAGLDSRRIGCDVGGLCGRLALPGTVDIVDAETVFAAARRPRDPWEVGELRRRVGIVDAGLGAARRFARAGATELDVATAAATEISGRLGAMVTLDHNIGSGPRSAAPDPRAGNRPIASGDLVLVDFYPGLDGYYADLTRTWAAGPATPRAVRLHQAVVAALRAGEELLRPGTAVAAIDAAVRGALRTAGGLDASMHHHTGHGLGIFAWEHPWIGADSDESLMAGDVVALEPGAYLPGFGGVRIEGNYLITEAGFERLDRCDEELIA